MKHFLPNAFLILISLILSANGHLQAQGKARIKIGKVSDFIEELHSIDSAGSNMRRSTGKVIKLDDSGFLKSPLKRFSKNRDVEIYAGRINSNQTSNAHVIIKNGAVSGSVILQKERKAYKYHTGKEGDLYLQEVPIDSLICIGLAAGPTTTPDTAAVMATVPQLESRPGSPAIVYLDFDGENVVSPLWNGGEPLTAAPSGFSAEEMYLTWAIMSEDFSPYNINVTTKRSVYDAKPFGVKNMCIFTPTNTVAPGTGGIANVGSFTSDYFAPSWAFNSTSKFAGETGSHEVGHTMDLVHDGYYNPVDFVYNDYYGGHSNNVWGPIMGAAFMPDVVQWSRGEYLNATSTQDDMAIIGSVKNKFGYVADEAGNSISNAKYLVYASTGIIDVNANAGVIHKNSDIDVYRFKTNGGNTYISVAPAAPVVWGGNTLPVANLDVKLELLNSSGTIVASSNPNGTAGPVLNLVLTAGVYFLRIDGVGYGNALTDGYSDYGSVGRYSISGTIQGASNSDFAISLVTPEDGAILLDPATVTFTPNLKSSPNVVSKVEYFEGSTKLGESTVAPFSFSKANFTEGSHTIFARATNSANQLINSQNLTFTIYRSMAGETAGNFNAGMVYEYFEGTYSSLPDFNTLTPLYRGISFMPVVEANSADVVLNRIDNFALRFKGYIYIEETNVFKFFLNSDEGSKLIIDNKIIVDNNGQHTALVKSGVAALKKGYHLIEIDYFEGTGSQILTLTASRLTDNSELYFSYYRKDINLGFGGFINKKLMPGIKYEYHEGSYFNLPTNFNNLIYKSVGSVPNINLSIPSRRADDFAVRYSGYIQIPYNGEWIFYLKSDDGSKLYINDQLVVTNDGTHDATIEKNGSVWLSSGKQKIRVEYFEKAGGESLLVSYSGPGAYKQLIPNASLNRDALRGEEITYENYVPTIPGIIETEFYNQGGEGYSYHDASAGNQFGLFRNDDVDINYGPADRYDNYMVVFEPSDWTTYTINSAGSGTYDVALTIGTGTTSNSYMYLFARNSGLTYGVSIPIITNGTEWQTVVAKNVYVGTGEQVFFLSTALNVNIDRFEFLEPSSARIGSNAEIMDESKVIHTAKVFPNPFDSKINIDVSDFENVASVKIFDLRGMIVWEANHLELSQNYLTFEKNIAGGIYIVEINADHKITHTTIVKSH